MKFNLELWSPQWKHGLHHQGPGQDPRLVLHTVLCEVEEALNLMGPNCNSWGLPARGTSSRTDINIFGAMQWDFVREGTMMISRTL